jgi:hypothetical protein
VRHLLLACCLTAGCTGTLSLGSSDGGTPGDAPVLEGAPRPDSGDRDLGDGTPADLGQPADLQTPAPDTGPGVWRPKPGATWHWQLRGTLDTSVNVQMYDIDLFDTSAATVTALQSAGRVVICYFSAGSWENWRPDAKDFPSAVKGKTLDGWDNERWVDVRSQQLRDIIIKRLDLAASKGCDGVEPDNVDGYINDSGFNLKAQDQLDFNIFLATESHQRGLSVGLKNDLGQITQLEPYFDWALNEECHDFNECPKLSPFITAGKAVFHVEYGGNKSKVCGTTQPLGFSTLFKKLELDAWFELCP